MTSQMYAPDRGRDLDGTRFDPIAEGQDYGLPPETLRRIWDHARAQASQGPGRIDVARAKEQFHDLAAQTAMRRTKTAEGRGDAGGSVAEGQRGLIDDRGLPPGG